MGESSTELGEWKSPKEEIQSEIYMIVSSVFFISYHWSLSMPPENIRKSEVS